MIRVAAIVLGLLAATPAAATCRTVPEFMAAAQANLPAGSVVREVSILVVPTIAAWMESEGLSGAARFLQVAAPGGIILVPVTADRVCETDTAYRLSTAQSVDLVNLMRRYRLLRGWGLEREA